MTSIKRHVVLYDSATAGTGSWVRLDNRYEEAPERPIQISLSAGDTVTIQGTTVDVRGGDYVAILAALTSADISTLKTYTTSDEDVLSGGWSWIRVVKTGTAGIAKVQGFV